MDSKLLEGYKNVPFEYFKGQLLQPGFRNLQEKIDNLEVKDDDVWLCCFAKTGSTWCQEMLWLIAHDYDYEGAKQYSQLRIPFLERAGADLRGPDADKILKEDSERYRLNSLDLIAKMNSPRCIKTHLFWDNLPQQIRDGTKKPKIVYLTRNPKDVAVALHNHSSIIIKTTPPIDIFCKIFTGESCLLGPFWKHVMPFYQRRNEENVLFLTFEELKADLKSVILKVVAFLGKTINDSQMKDLLEHLSIESMRNNPSLNNKAFHEKVKQVNNNNYEGSFINKGTVGRHKEVLSSETIEMLDKWIEENTKGTDLKFQ